jgi:hypothetical protein
MSCIGISQDIFEEEGRRMDEQVRIILLDSVIVKEELIVLQ